MLTKTCSIAKWFINSWLYDNYVATVKDDRLTSTYEKSYVNAKLSFFEGHRLLKKGKIKEH